MNTYANLTQLELLNIQLRRKQNAYDNLERYITDTRAAGWYELYPQNERADVHGLEDLRVEIIDTQAHIQSIEQQALDDEHKAQDADYRCEMLDQSAIRAEL